MMRADPVLQWRKRIGMGAPRNVECLFRSKSGKPQFWIKYTGGRTLVYDEGIPVEVADFSGVVHELKKYLRKHAMPWYDSAIYSMVLNGKLPGKFKMAPAVTFMGMPSRTEVIMFADFSMFDGNDHYESVNELCFELKFNEHFRKKIMTLEVVAIHDERMAQFVDRVTEAARTMRPAELELPTLS